MGPSIPQDREHRTHPCLSAFGLRGNSVFLQDVEGLCREAGKQAADWAASIRSTAELADETGYELCSGRNRSLAAIKNDKRERTRQVMRAALACPLHH